MAMEYNFGKNNTARTVKDTVNLGKSYCCELRRNVRHKENDVLIFNGVRKTFAEWRDIVGAATSYAEIDAVINPKK